MTLASVPCGPASASAAAAPAGWTAPSSDAGCDCAEAGSAAFGDLLQMLAGSGPGGEEGFDAAGAEGWCGFTINADAALAADIACGQRQLLPHVITMAGPDMGVALAPGNAPDKTLDPQMDAAEATDSQLLPTSSEQVAEAPVDEAAPKQSLAEQRTSGAALQAAVPVEAPQLETAAVQTETPEVQPETSGDPAEAAEGQVTKGEAPAIPIAPVSGRDSAASSRIPGAKLSGDDAEIAADEPEADEGALAGAEMLVLAPPPAVRDDTPVLKAQGHPSGASEQRPQTPVADRNAIQPQLQAPAGAGTASGSGGREDKTSELAFSAKLVECERPGVNPEATDAQPVLRMESVSPASSHPVATAVPAAAIGIAHEYAAKPASPFQAPVVIEPISPADTPSAASGPARELRLSVAQEVGAGARVEVRVSERAGEVRVAVQSPDPNVRAAVRSDLSSLVSRLEQVGYNTEVSQPQNARASDDILVAESSRARSGSESDHNPPSADAASRDSSGWDSNEGRRERREAPPHPFAPARPKAPGRRFVDEFIR